MNSSGSERAELFRMPRSTSKQCVMLLVQDFVFLHLQYLSGKPFFLNDNYKEVKQKFAEEFGDKARFPWMMKKIRSGCAL